MQKFALIAALAIPSTNLFAAAGLPRGSTMFSSCTYTGTNGQQVEYQVDDTVGVLDAQIVKGCPIGMTYEFGETAVVYSLAVAEQNSCKFQLPTVGDVLCIKK